MTQAESSLLDSFSVLSDPTRCRMLAILDRQELTVTELCTVLQLPQSTVSRQLKTLADAGWVSSRRDGTSRYYALASDGAAASQTKLWDLTRPELRGRTEAAGDLARLSQVLARRSEASQQFFASAAGRWDRLRDELFGASVFPRALLALLPREWTMCDLGCGTGALLPVLAPHVRAVIGVDASDEMLAAARARAAALTNVDVRRGALEALPIADGTLDAAVMLLVLHHVPAPAAALADARRVLRPGGSLLVVDMVAHDREQYRQQMGHVWLGFSDDHVRRLLDQAGFTDVRLDPCEAGPKARGPGLFLAVARTPGPK
jgi:ArsR family transcriptional regulator